MSIQLGCLFVHLWRDTMLRFLLMGRLEQAKPTLCKASSTVSPMKREGLFQERLKIFSDIFRAVKIKK